MTPQQRWSARNPGAHARATKRWREKNKDKVRQYAKTYRENNQEVIAKSQVKWRANLSPEAKAIHSGKMRALHSAYRKRHPIRNLLGSIKKRDPSTDLTLEKLEELCGPMRCSMTGHKLCWEWPKSVTRNCNPWKPSVDRIDPSKGYVVGNVRVVSWIYNLAKSTWTDEVVAQFRGDGP